MCGITGVLTHARSIGEHLEAVSSLTALMERRGPDDQGEWTDGSHMALGFRRLSILDLSRQGHQPMVSPCGRHVLVFNGEVYNFRELRRDLESRGHTFRSHTDTEVVLLALAQWGKAALPRLNGMFALGWYDRDRRRLLLARDPMGIKPLYYGLAPEGLVFGSQYDQVVRHAFCSRKLCAASLGLFLRLGYIPAPHALFQGTHLLPPGHALCLEAGGEPRLAAYYHPQEESGELCTSGRAAEEGGPVISAAVRRQMVSDVPLGAFLSGGVDSPLVAAQMRQASSEVHAFTIGSTDPRFDEAPVARAYAEQLSLRHTVDAFRPADCLSLVEEGARAYTEPFGDFSSLPSLLLCRSTRQHVTVALSGDGGDELFWGYPRFAKISRHAGWFRYPQPVRTAAYAAGRALRKSIPRGVLFPGVGDWQFDGQCFSGLRGVDLEQLCEQPLPPPEGFDFYAYTGPPEPEPVARWLRRNELWGHLQMVLLKMDRASMHYSLEVRVPLLDLQVVELAARVAPQACMANAVGKLPLREILARSVPPDAIPERKAGFSVPLGDWLRRELRPLVEDLLLDGDPYPFGLFRRPALRRLYQRHLEGEDLTRALWHLLSLQLWRCEHLHPAFPLTSAQRVVPCA